MASRLFVTLLVLCGTALNAFSQTYSELAGTNIEARRLGSVATGDLNNDGYLDIVTTGVDEASEFVTNIYSNNHDGTFTMLNVPGLTPMYNSSISVGDYNNDGHPDILLAGEGPDPLCVLWKNNGNLTFSLVDAGLDPLGGYNAEFRDIDNDGDIDVLTSGTIRTLEGSYFSDVRLYKNVGSDQFERQELAFTSYANVGTMGDYDNDGDLDLLSGGNRLEIYPNRGDGTFSSPELLDIPLPSGQIKWFDQNNDGNPDFLVSGRGLEADEYYTDVYVSSGGSNISFSKLAGTAFSAAMRQELDVRDYTGDGMTDILFTGMVDIANNEFKTTIYDNTGDSFIENTDAGLPQLGGGDAVWFDVDNDGDLDILATGEMVAGANVPKAVIMRNEGGTNLFTPNTQPSAPTDVQIAYSEEDGTIVYSWNEGSDLETPVAGLSYNIAIGTTLGGVDVLSPESNPETGQRLIYRVGNAEHNLQKSIKGLADGIYYLRVQTIDGALAGSPFSVAEKLAIGIPGPPSEVMAETEGTNGAVISWQDNSNNEFQFIVEAKSNVEDDFSVVGEVEENETSLVVDDLPNGTYTVRVKAINPNGESEYVHTEIFATGVPEDPTNLTLELLGDNVVLTWEDVLNETGYEIERSLDSGPYAVVGSVEMDVTNFTDSPPTSGLYQYQVTATNSNGQSVPVVSIPQTVVGIEEEFSDRRFSVFPNPVSSRLWIDGDGNLMQGSHFSLYNSQGQRLPVSSSGAYIDVQGLAKGVYLLKAYIGKQVITKKILVE